MNPVSISKPIAVVAIGALVLSTVAVGWLVLEYERTQVSIDSVNWQVIENGSSVGYVCDGSCVGVPIHTTAGAVVVVPLRLFGTTYPSGLDVHAVSSALDFALVGVYPTIPYNIPQGEYATFNVTVQVPASPGSYDFVGTVSASYA